jgi:hypothetical protein
MVNHNGHHSMDVEGEIKKMEKMDLERNIALPEQPTTNLHDLMKLQTI